MRLIVYRSTVKNDLIGVVESVEGRTLKKCLSFRDDWEVKDRICYFRVPAAIFNQI